MYNTCWRARLQWQCGGIHATLGRELETEVRRFIAANRHYIGSPNTRCITTTVYSDRDSIVTLPPSAVIVNIVCSSRWSSVFAPEGLSRFAIPHCEQLDKYFACTQLPTVCPLKTDTPTKLTLRHLEIAKPGTVQIYYRIRPRRHHKQAGTWVGLHHCTYTFDDNRISCVQDLLEYRVRNVYGLELTIPKKYSCILSYFKL